MVVRDGMLADSFMSSVLEIHLKGYPDDLCQGLNSHYFHIIGDGHQPNSRGLYIYIYPL